MRILRNPQTMLVVCLRSFVATAIVASSLSATTVVPAQVAPPPAASSGLEYVEPVKHLSPDRPARVLKFIAVSPAPKAAAAAPPQRPSRTSRLIRNALAYRGTPYRFGARGRGGFDCSGFTSYLFDKAGKPIARSASAQYRQGAPVEKSALRPGDLVFFKNTYKRGVSHVGIYIGNGNFIHAASSRSGVRVDSLNKSYYAKHWAGARRRL